MVFIRRSAGRSGSTKVQLAERRAGRNVILEHIGTAHDEAELAVLMEVARERLRPGQAAFDLGLDEAPSGVGRAPGVITGKRSAVLWSVLTGAYARLGFDVLGDEAFKQLVLARLVEPTSKADSLRVLDEIGVPHASLRTMFRALGRAQERDYRGQIAAACFAHAAAHGDLTLVLYDVTTLYFEAEHEHDLRKVGFSKERRVDPQIIVGLLVDRYGFPREIGCWEGNKAEKHTIVPVIEAFQARHGIEDLVVVADAGMLSLANLKALDEAGHRFIVGAKVSKAPIDLAAHFRWNGDAFSDGQLIDTVTPKIGKNTDNNIAQRAEPAWDSDEHPGSWRAVWAYSAKRFARDNRTLTAQENRARAVVDGQKAARTPRFVKTTGDARVLDEAALARARRLAGLRGVRHQRPAREPVSGRGRGLLPRPVARRTVLPPVQERPQGAPAVRQTAGLDRGALDHRVHRASDIAHRASPYRALAAPIPAPATTPALGHHRNQRRRPDSPARDRTRRTGHPRRPQTAGSKALSRLT